MRPNVSSAADHWGGRKISAFIPNAALIVRALDYLLATQSAAGSWPSAPYYYGGPKKAVSWGSPELTTGLCLEALVRHTPHITEVFPCVA